MIYLDQINLYIYQLYLWNELNAIFFIFIILEFDF